MYTQLFRHPHAHFLPSFLPRNASNSVFHNVQHHGERSRREALSPSPNITGGWQTVFGATKPRRPLAHKLFFLLRRPFLRLSVSFITLSPNHTQSPTSPHFIFSLSSPKPCPNTSRSLWAVTCTSPSRRVSWPSKAPRPSSTS